MTNKPNDPPAFPFADEYYREPGMSLRDYFAAAAMQAIISRPECRNWESSSIPSESYKIADAMLAERNKP